MRRLLDKVLSKSIRKPGSGREELQFPVEFDEHDRLLVQRIISAHLTMVSPERLFATLLACRYVLRRGIPGDFLECGVWRGGNSLIAASVFSRAKATERRVKLFDTFTGMTEPTEHDFTNQGHKLAFAKFEANKQENYNSWCYASIDDVRKNFVDFDLLDANVDFVAGDVCDTLKNLDNLPEQIAVLRLDTDWYESTKVELEILWPRLESGGVLIVDDYGHWGGAKKAVDEFFSGNKAPFFSYIDSTGRLAIKE